MLYLPPDGELGITQPTSTAGPSTFIYDPADPTPAVGGRVINPALGGYRDNRELPDHSHAQHNRADNEQDAYELAARRVIGLSVRFRRRRARP